MCKFHCKATLFSLSFERNVPSAITSDSENVDSVSNSSSKSSSSGISSSSTRTPYRVIQRMLKRRHVFLFAALQEMCFCLELCLSLNLQVVYTRNWPKLFRNVANVHNATTMECQCPIERVLSVIFRWVWGGTHRFDFLKDPYKIVASQLGDVPLWPFIRLKQSGKKMRIFGYILEAFGHTENTRKNNIL